MLLVVSKSRFKLKGGRAFAVAAPNLWNSLPLHIRTAPSLITFKSSLKSYFFLLAFSNQPDI
ncbi:hypothetical protein LDENG_00031080 [Lucifuga dentata]|nr:hypothetical protein LDENG_00031080 [Lucifuga dentata]